MAHVSVSEEDVVIHTRCHVQCSLFGGNNTTDNSKQKCLKRDAHVSSYIQIYLATEVQFRPEAIFKLN